MTTNVRARELNYTCYSMRKYDRDIVNSIPYHKDLHTAIAKYATNHRNKDEEFSILDLGVGTGITSKLLLQLLPHARLDVIDYSKQMLAHARARLGAKRVRYIFGDYSDYKFGGKYNLVVSVIGIHHQTHVGKRRLFKKVYKLLNPGGVFIFGDLVTYTNKPKAAYNQALHFHHLVKRASDKFTLTDWAHHHLFLNNLAPLEDQIAWLTKTGFKVLVAFNKMNTALLVCKK